MFLKSLPPSYTSYTHNGWVFYYDPSLSLDEIRGRVTVNQGWFFKNARPTETLTAYRGHLVVIDEPLYEGQPKRCTVYAYDPTTGRVVSVASALDKGGPTPEMYREFIDTVRESRPTVAQVIAHDTVRMVADAIRDAEEETEKQDDY